MAANAAPHSRPAATAHARAAAAAPAPQDGDLAASIAQLADDSDPGRALGSIVALRRQLDDAEARQVDAALRAGWSWSRIGSALEISKQAAHRKHSRRRALVAPTERPHEEPIADPGTAADGRPRMTIAGEARVAVGHARREAAALGAAEVAPEHLLAGLACAAGGTVARALAASGVTLEPLRAALAAVAAAAGSEAGAPDPRPAGAAPTGARLPVSAGSRRVFAQALREALAAGREDLGAEHLLLALLDERERVPELLARLGADTDGVRAALDRERSAATPRAA